jgi:hypothetical protein
MDKFHVLKPIRTAELGGVKVGKIVELHPLVAREYLRVGAVERYETKVIKESPLSDAGEVTQSSASPVAPALPETTLKPSRRGGRRKKTEQ